MKQWFWKTLAALSLGALGVVSQHIAGLGRTLSRDQDPNSIDDVLWAYGLNENMNLDHAIAGMTHDRWPVRIC
jgi:hypothetical protein